MPAGIARIIGMRKADREAAQAFSGNPPAWPDQYVERGMQQGCVGRAAKWWF
jgi:hypothetical protein